MRRDGKSSNKVEEKRQNRVMEWRLTFFFSFFKLFMGLAECCLSASFVVWRPRWGKYRQC